MDVALNLWSCNAICGSGGELRPKLPICNAKNRVVADVGMSLKKFAMFSVLPCRQSLSFNLGLLPIRQ